MILEMDENSQNSTSTQIPPRVPNSAPVSGEVVKPGTTDETKTLVTVLLLIFVYPAGFVLMWVWAKWKTWVKALVTCVSCLPILIAIIAFFGAAILAVINPSAQFEKARQLEEQNNSIQQQFEQNLESPLPETQNLP